MSESAPSVADAWKEHVGQCGLCGNAKGMNDLCPIGRNFWPKVEVPVPPAVPVYIQPPYPQQYPPQFAQYPPQYLPQYLPPYQPQFPVEHQQPQPQQPHSQPQGVYLHPAAVVDASGALVLDAGGMADIARRVTERVVARTSSGAAIAVPMEKTSRAVSFSTAPGVVMHMPERDIEIYSEMQGMISKIARLADSLSKAVLVAEETKRFVELTPGMERVSQHQVAVVVRRVSSHFGTGSEEELFYEFEQMTAMILRMGDRFGQFMRVDDETRKIIRTSRSLAIDMQGELERDPGRLRLDEETRRLVRPLRMLALDFQSEIERRVGT